MTRRRNASWFWLTLVPLAWLAGCAKFPDPWEGKGGPPRVLVSFPPLYCFAKNVAGDHAGIISLCTTTGPHHYQPNVQDNIYLEKADLFLANGLTLDEKFCDPLEKAGRPSMLYVKLGDKLPHSMLLHTGEEGREHVHADGTVCTHGEHDPHVWLGIPQTLAMVKRIRDSFKKVDPAHATDYDANTEAYLAKIRKMHEEGKALLAAKKDRKMITFHEALGYFAAKDSFDLDVAGVIMEGPGDEPSSPRLANLIKLVEEKNVGVLTVEPQYPRTTSAHVLLTELKRKGFDKVSLVEIDPLETATAEDLQDPDWYIRKMLENVQNLAKALP